MKSSSILFILSCVASSLAHSESYFETRMEYLKREVSNKSLYTRPGDKLNQPLSRSRRSITKECDIDLIELKEIHEVVIDLAKSLSPSLPMLTFDSDSCEAHLLKIPEILRTVVAKLSLGNLNSDENFSDVVKNYQKIITQLEEEMKALNGIKDSEISSIQRKITEIQKDIKIVTQERDNFVVQHENRRKKYFNICPGQPYIPNVRVPVRVLFSIHDAEQYFHDLKLCVVSISWIKEIEEIFAEALTLKSYSTIVCNDRVLEILNNVWNLKDVIDDKLGLKQIKFQQIKTQFEQKIVAKKELLANLRLMHRQRYKEDWVTLAKSMHNFNANLIAIKKSVQLMKDELSDACSKLISCEMSNLCIEMVNEVKSQDFLNQLLMTLHDQDIEKIHLLLDFKLLLGSSQEFSLESFNINMDAWLEKVSNSNYNPIKSFSIKYYKAFATLLPMLVEKIYGNDILNFHQIIKLKDELPWLSHHGMIYKALYDAMAANNHLENKEIFILGYYLKSRYEDTPNGNEVSLYFEPLKNRIPVGVQRIYFDPWIKFKNVEISQYTLYTGTDGSVYTYPDHNDSSLKQRWIVTVMDNGKYFRFRCEKNQEVLFADSTGNVYTGRVNAEDLRQHWEIIPLDNAKTFYLKNRSNDRVLDAGYLFKCSSSKTESCSRVTGAISFTKSDRQKWLIV